MRTIFKVFIKLPGATTFNLISRSDSHVIAIDLAQTLKGNNPNVKLRVIRDDGKEKKTILEIE